MFKPIVKAEHIKFEKDMLFTTPKQFKEAITDYAMHGGWGIRFVKDKSSLPGKLQVCGISNKATKGEELPTKNIEPGTHIL